MKRPFLYIALSLCAGILISGPCGLPVAVTALLSAAFTAAALLARRRVAFSHAMLYLAVIFLGMAWYRNALILPKDHIRNLVSDEPRAAVVTGSIVDDPVTEKTRYGDRTRFLLSAASVQDGPPARSATGLVAVSLYSDRPAPFRFADKVMLEGLISRPWGLKNPGLFDYRRYQEIRNIYAVLRVKEGSRARVVGRDSAGAVRRLAYRLRSAVKRTLDRYCEEPYAGFLKAILIGERTGLDCDIRDDFVKTGTVHIIAISGLNVTLIAGLVLACFGVFRVPKKAGLMLTIAFLAVYAVMTGAGAPIVRAVIIFAIIAVGYMIGRQADPLNSLAIAAFLVLLYDPKELFDPGFQLSFVSIAGIVICAPRLNALMKVDAIPRNSFAGRAKIYLLTGISVSLAAWIGTWPFIAAYFNIISPVSILANLVVIPMLFVITVNSAALVFAAPVCGLCANALAIALQLENQALFSLNHILAQLPGAYVRVPSPSALFAAAYYAAAFLCISPKEIIVFRRLRIGRKAALAAVLAVLNILLWKDIVMADRAAMRVTFLDVGQGDAAVVEFPGGRTMLIDAGSGGEDASFDAGRSVIAPYLWNRGVSKIDAVVLTHLHEDHMGGVIYVLDNFTVGAVIDNGIAPSGSGVYDAYLRALRRAHARRITVGAGDTVRLSGAAAIEVLNPARGEPPDGNNDTIVLKISYGRCGILFCGDIMAKAMARMLDGYGALLKSDIIKVPHHGGNAGDESIVKEFFSVVGPRAAVVSVGRANKYKMPSSITMNIIKDSRANSYVTRDDGAISVTLRNDFCEIRKTAHGN